ncbi:hypothetical protein C8R47DRAFT_1049752 [Mycena vitilis]|nr:hypothetical protein C8R47DRAFT_1049752 [Mycena vitilis]
MAPACITANPDISGIGVRTAIYAQNFLCFFPVAAYLRDGTVSLEGMKGIKDQSIGMLAIAFAILISTIIQATTAVSGQQISRFHAAVILDLSWMNNTSTWIWFILYAHHLSKPDKRKRRCANHNLHCPKCRLGPGRGAIAATPSDWARLLFSKSCNIHMWSVSGGLPIFRLVERAWDLFARAPVLMLGSFHLSLMSAIGIWLWLNPSKFGVPISCDPTLTVVGGPASFISRPLQIFSLVMYFLLLIPAVNLLLPILFFLALHIAYNSQREYYYPQMPKSFPSRQRSSMLSVESSTSPSSSSSSKPFSGEAYTNGLVAGLALLVVINLIFLVDIELTLARNKNLQSGEDDVWGFGQVLALLLLVVPLRDAWNALRDIRKAVHGVQEQFDRVVQEEMAARPFVLRLEDLLRQGAKANGYTSFADWLQVGVYRAERDLVDPVLAVPSSAWVETRPSGIFGTVLCAACAAEDLDMIRLLIQKGAKAEFGGDRFGSALHIAALMGNTKIVKVLLDDLQRRNVNPNIEWCRYGTALDVAEVLLYSDLVRVLTERGLKLLVQLRSKDKILVQPALVNHTHLLSTGQVHFFSAHRQ